MIDVAFAFQPIVDVESGLVWAHEALVRGPDQESAAAVLSRHSGDDLYRFDAALQIEAIRHAVALDISGRLSVNLLSSTLRVAPDSFDATLACAVDSGLGADQLMIEVSERDAVNDIEAFLLAIRPGRQAGIDFALDDFGAGYSGLNLLARFQPNYIKLDRVLVSEIWHSGPRQAIVRGVMRTCLDLGIEVIAEGVETSAEFEWLWDNGIRLFQGYLFARPGFESFPEPALPPFSD